MDEYLEESDRAKDSHFCPICRCRYPLVPPRMNEAIQNSIRLANEVVEQGQEIKRLRRALRDK